MHWTAVVLGVGFGIAFTGCDEETNVSTATCARVGSETLTSEQVRSHIPKGLGLNDSTAAAQHYIDQWVREQILVAQAETALPSEAVKFEEEIKAYRNALILHAFKERYVSERMDDEVSDAEALQFYKANQESFLLTDYAARLLFINAPATASLDKIRAPFAALDSTGMIDIERWCVENGAVYSLDGSTWWTLSAFTKEVPMNFYRTESQLSSRRLVDFEAEGRHYLVRFIEHALKDEIAPFTSVRNEVTEMILHRRKHQLLLTMEEQLVVKAWAEGLVEVGGSNRE